MTTTLNLINSSLKLLNVASDIAPADSSQQQEGYRILSNYLRELDQEGVDIGVPFTISITSELNEYWWVSNHLEALLAREMAPHFQADLSLELKKKIRKAEDAISIHGVPVPNTTYSDNLPTGQGNRRGARTRVYFNADDPAS